MIAWIKRLLGIKPKYNQINTLCPRCKYWLVPQNQYAMDKKKVCASCEQNEKVKYYLSENDKV